MEMVRDELEALARRLSVRADVLEKVVRLLDVLRRMQESEEIRRSYALKGGTALNVFWLPLPRLSIDIDINFVGEVASEALTVHRTAFEQHVFRACQLAGCRVLRSPHQHAGGKSRLRFASTFGGEQNLELDISYVARVPLFGLVERGAALHDFEGTTTMTYTLPELAAGKFTALLARTVARDRFDATRLLAMDPELLERQEFRTAFVCHAAADRKDARQFSAELAPMPVQEVRNKLVPVLREAMEPLARDSRALAQQLGFALEGVAERLTRWSDAELGFLEALMDHGELKPELLTPEPELQRRIAAQPMLRWKQKNVRQHKGRIQPIDKNS